MSLLHPDQQARRRCGVPSPRDADRTKIALAVEDLAELTELPGG